MSKIYVKYEYIPIDDPYCRLYIPVRYSEKALKIDNAHQIYNIENYDNIGSLALWPIKNIIEELRPNKFVLPKNLKYFKLNLLGYDRSIDCLNRKEYLDQIEFPDRLLELDVDSPTINIDIECNIRKLTINTQCQNIISLPKKVKYLVYDSTQIWFDNRMLKSLPDLLPQNLVYLDCSRGLLTKLPELPDTLEVLLCDSNELTELSKLPPNLKELVCYNNKLTKLPELPKTINYLNCSQNNIDDLPLSLANCKLNESLHYCNTYINRCMRKYCTPRHNPNCKCDESTEKYKYTPYAISQTNNYKKIVSALYRIYLLIEIQ